MAQQTINVGAAPNDGTGTPLRTAFQYTNSNFTELYTATGPSGNNINVPGAATITGNLTVDTSTFAVDAANNRVFIGTAPVSTAYPLFVTRGGTAGSIAQFTDGTAHTLTIDSAAGGLLVGNANNGYVAFTANGLEQYRIAPLGVFTWADGAGGTRMTLNSTGLGVGVASPSYQIHARKDQAAFTTVAIDNNNAIAAGTGAQFLLLDSGVDAGWFRRNRDGSGNTDIGYKDTLRFRGQITGTERTDMTLDTSGNVISNVTGTAPTLATNSQMVFNLTSNTNLRISVRGTDGTTRTADITLA